MSTRRLSKGPRQNEPDRLGRPHTRCSTGYEGGPAKLEYGGVPGLDGTTPVTEDHYGDGLLQDLLPADPQLPLPESLPAGSTETWSQMIARIPGKGVEASTGGSTTSEATSTEVQEPGATSPPPGLTPLDFTNWSLPLPEAPLTGGLPLPLGGLPRIRRQTAGPWTPGQWAPTPPMHMPSAPQGTLPIHQQRPCQLAAPYQQAAQQVSQPAAPYQQAAQQASQPAAPYQQVLQ